MDVLMRTAMADYTMGHVAAADSSINDLLRMLPFPQMEQELLGMRLGADLVGVGDSAAAAAAGPAFAEMLWAEAPTEADEMTRLMWLNGACLVGLWSVKRNRPDMTARAEDALARHRVAPTDMTSGSNPRGPGPDLQLVSAGVDVCQAMFHAVVAANRGSGDQAALVARLDSLVDTHLTDNLQWAIQAMLTSAALKADMGDSQAALATVRRRYHWWSQPESHVLLPPSLRLEGRLAAEVGDTAGAVRAYQHYLALRYDPDPQLQPEADAVRAELARLLGEPEG
jgi:hypothetical protein